MLIHCGLQTIDLRQASLVAVLDDAAFGAATPVVPKIRLARRPGRALDGSQWRARLLADCTNYLIDLKRRRHRRCGGDNRSPTGRPSSG